MRYSLKGSDMSNKHNYLIFFLCCSFFSPLLASDEHHPFIHPFMTFKFGQQWALDDNYEHCTPYSELFGLYSGLQFSSSLGWGIGYQYHDDTFSSVTKVNLKTTLIESTFHYQWQLKDDRDIYGHIGLAYWNIKK